MYRDHHEGICAASMARMRRLGSATVGRIYAEFTGRKARERESLQCPRILGIDEHRVHRGMPFATTFCDLKNRRIFDIVPGPARRNWRASWAVCKVVKRLEWSALTSPVLTGLWCENGSPTPRSWPIGSMLFVFSSTTSWSWLVRSFPSSKTIEVF